MNEKKKVLSTEKQQIQDSFCLVNNLEAPTKQSMKKYKTKIIQKFEGNWEKFFLDFEENTTKALHEIQFQNRVLSAQNNMLYKQNKEIRQQIQYMEERERMREQKEIEKQNAKHKRKKTKRLPVRDAITIEEFEQILHMVDRFYQDPFVRARLKIGLILLYTTGLRISNLLVLTKRNVCLLALEGECQTAIIKGGAQRKTLYIGTKGKELFQKFHFELTHLCLHQSNDGSTLFSTKWDSSKPISKRSLIGQINNILKYASTIFGKHLRSHSFRASYITDLLDQGVPIEKTKDIIGHSHIGTTATYRRSLVTLKELRKTITALNQGRIHRVREHKTDTY